jgi:hypothetical protein
MPQMKRNVVFWVFQGLLAVLFLFTGGMKLVIPVEQMQQGPTALPGWFLRFLGVAEILGALGLILPGLFRIKTVLTPVAAGCLLIIMIGAATLTAKGLGLAPALLPFVTGVLLCVVIYGRWGGRFA